MKYLKSMFKKISITIFCCILSINLFAQLNTESPYSYFGLGDLSKNAFPINNALGGASTSLYESNIINPYNPASYTSFLPNTFMLSTGIWHKTTDMQNNTESQITNNTSFSHFNIGFPINNKIGFSMGLIPFSSTGYDFNSRNDVNELDMIYSGDGDLSRFYFGAGYKLTEELSLGLNASYLFGSLNRRSKLIYDDNSFLNSRSNHQINLRGYYYEIGAKYSNIFKDNKELILSATLNNDSKIRVNETILVETFEFYGIEERVQDTSENSSLWGNAILPQQISIGLSIKEGKKWLAIIDYNTQDWSRYSVLDKVYDLNNSMKISGGIQYVPEYNSVSQYYKRIKYRFGSSYAITPLELNGNIIKEKSVSIGFGFPFKNSGTHYDIAISAGQRGALSNDLIKEEFVRFSFSVTYQGLWFIKRKYD